MVSRRGDHAWVHYGGEAERGLEGLGTRHGGRAYDERSRRTHSGAEGHDRRFHTESDKRPNDLAGFLLRGSSRVRNGSFGGGGAVGREYPASEVCSLGI